MVLRPRFVCSCLTVDENPGPGMRHSSNEVQHFPQIRALSEPSFKFPPPQLYASGKAMFDRPLLASYAVTAIRSHRTPKSSGTR